jgi:hypothetical protein
VLLLSALLWLFAQLGGRQLVHDALGATFGARIPLEATGSFDQFAWQLLWVLGLWLGSSFADRSIRAAIPAWMLPAAFAVAAGFLLWRHGLAGFAFDLQPVAFALDKWSLGVLRLLNFAALAVVVAQLLLPLLRWAHVGVLALLGRASLQVFCVHLVLCVASLGLIVDDDTPLTAAQEALVVLVTFAVMVLVARRTAAAAKRRRTGKPPAPTPRRA